MFISTLPFQKQSIPVFFKINFHVLIQSIKFSCGPIHVKIQNIVTISQVLFAHHCFCLSICYRMFRVTWLVDGWYFGCREDVRLYTWLCGLILLLVGVDSFSHWLLMSCDGLECSLHQWLLCYCSFWVFIVRPQKIYFFFIFPFS
mgnify:CR=1 FL=1